MDKLPCFMCFFFAIFKQRKLLGFSISFSVGTGPAQVRSSLIGMNLLSEEGLCRHLLSFKTSAPLRGQAK